MRKCFFASSLFGATRCSALLIFNGALSSPTFIRHSKEWIRQATRSSNCQTWPIRIASSPSTGSAINHYHQLQMSYVADSSEYGSSDYDGNDGRDDSDADSDAKSVAGVRGFNEFADVPSIEELPVPMSKNSGSRFVAFVWDKDLDAIRVTTKGGKRKTREELHDERSEKIEDHILWARKANLYNETFNNNSVADVVWSYPLLSADKHHQIGHAICIDSNSVQDAQELLSREPMVQSLITKGDTSNISMYRWRHIKDASLQQDDGRFGTPTMIISMDRTDDAVQGLRAMTNVSHIEYLIKSERVVTSGPLHVMTEHKSDTSSVAVGSLVIMNAMNRTHAIEFAENDPCALAGLYESIRVHVFNNLDISGKFVLPDQMELDAVDEIREAMEIWGYPVSNRQTPWINV